MQVSLKEVFNDLESKRQLCYQTLMDLLPEYIYREKRYQIHFSVTLIYSQDHLATCERGLRPLLRKTDKLLCITPHLLCATFDATNTSSYVKAAENLHETLKKIDYQHRYFIATVSSQEFDENYLDMFNRLYERLLYSIEHQLCNIVNFEDYII